MDISGIMKDIFGMLYGNIRGYQNVNIYFYELLYLSERSMYHIIRILKYDK